MFSFDPTMDEDLTALQATVRQVLERHAPSIVPSPQSPPGAFDSPLWKLLAEQVGVAGLVVPERFGGSEYGYLACHLVLSELGRTAVASPFLASSVLATQALLLAADEPVLAEILPSLATGTRCATIVLPPQPGFNHLTSLTPTMLTPTPLTATPLTPTPLTPNSLTPNSLTATPTSTGWTVSGQAHLVLDGARADLLLAFTSISTGSRSTANSPASGSSVSTHDSADSSSSTSSPDSTSTSTSTSTSDSTGIALFQLDVNHPGLRRTVSPTMDQALHLADLHCTDVPAQPLQTISDHRQFSSASEHTLTRLMDLAAIAVTAEQVGGARRCLEMTVEYVQQRVQFGRPIGSFQAIKHRLADLLVLVESADSASQAAAQAWAGDTADTSPLASLAKSYCSQAYSAVTAETLQLHGGIGITWEHPAHRYFKRAHSTAALFGSPTHHRTRLTSMIMKPP